MDSTGRPRFLTGRWEHLAMINFACPAELLEPLVPNGTELDAPDGATGLHERTVEVR